jgi:iron complex transport system ATP-binding protein
VSNRKITIITGKKHSGKTTFLLNKIAGLQSKGVTVGGLISVGTFKNGSRFDFKLLDVVTDQKVDFLSQKECNFCKKIGRFYINPKAFEYGFKVLEKCLKDPFQTIVLDEIGPLEIKDQGWAVILPELLESESDLILVVRKELLQEVISKWGINYDKIIEVE